MVALTRHRLRQRRAIRLILIVIVSSLLGAASDISRRRIPNWLTVSLFLAALTRAAGVAGWFGVTGAMEAGAAVLVFLLPLYVVKALGAGDVKMVAALSAFWPWPHWPGLLLNIGVAGLGLALLVAWWSAELETRLRNVIGILTTVRVTGELAAFPVENGQLPFGVAIALGATATLFWSPARLWS